MIQRNRSKRGTIKLRSSELEEPVEFEVPLSRTQKKKLTIKKVSKLLSENSVSSFQKAEQISSVLTYGQFLPKQNERGDLIFTEGNDIQYMKSQVNQNFDSKLIQSKIKNKNFQSASNMQNIIDKNGNNANSCYSECVSNFSQNVKGQIRNENFNRKLGKGLTTVSSKIVSQNLGQDQTQENQKFNIVRKQKTYNTINIQVCKTSQSPEINNYNKYVNNKSDSIGKGSIASYFNFERKNKIQNNLLQEGKQRLNHNNLLNLSNSLAILEEKSEYVVSQNKIETSNDINFKENGINEEKQTNQKSNKIQNEDKYNQNIQQMIQQQQNKKQNSSLDSLDSIQKFQSISPRKKEGLDLQENKSILIPNFSMVLQNQQQKVNQNNQNSNNEKNSSKNCNQNNSIYNNNNQNNSNSKSVKMNKTQKNINIKGLQNEKWSFAMSDSFSPAKKQEKKKKKIYMNESQTPQTQRMLTMKKNKENLQKILMNTSSKPADSFKNKNEDETIRHMKRLKTFQEFDQKENIQQKYIKSVQESKKDLSINQIVSLLQLGYDYRKQDDNNQMIKYFSKYEFFQKLNKLYDDWVIKAFINQLKFKFYRKNTFIIEQNSQKQRQLPGIFLLLKGKIQIIEGNQFQSQESIMEKEGDCLGQNIALNHQYIKLRKQQNQQEEEVGQKQNLNSNQNQIYNKNSSLNNGQSLMNLSNAQQNNNSQNKRRNSIFDKNLRKISKQIGENTIYQVQVLEDCWFAYMDKDQFQDLIDLIISNDKTEVTNFFKNLPIFKDLQQSTLNQVLPYFEQYKYQKNQVIFNENQQVDRIYIIQKGIVKTYKKLKEQKEDDLKRIQKEHQLCHLKRKILQQDRVQLSIFSAGQIFGYEDILIKQEQQFQNAQKKLNEQQQQLKSLQYLDQDESESEQESNINSKNNINSNKYWFNERVYPYNIRNYTAISNDSETVIYSIDIEDMVSMFKQIPQIYQNLQDLCLKVCDWQEKRINNLEQFKIKSKQSLIQNDLKNIKKQENVDKINTGQIDLSKQKINSSSEKISDEQKQIQKQIYKQYKQYDEQSRNYIAPIEKQIKIDYSYRQKIGQIDKVNQKKIKHLGNIIYDIYQERFSRLKAQEREDQINKQKQIKNKNNSQFESASELSVKKYQPQVKSKQFSDRKSFQLKQQFNKSLVFLKDNNQCENSSMFQIDQEGTQSQINQSQQFLNYNQQNNKSSFLIISPIKKNKRSLNYIQESYNCENQKILNSPNEFESLKNESLINLQEQSIINQNINDKKQEQVYQHRKSYFKYNNQKQSVQSSSVNESKLKDIFDENKSQQFQQKDQKQPIDQKNLKQNQNLSKYNYNQYYDQEQIQDVDFLKFYNEQIEQNYQLQNFDNISSSNKNNNKMCEQNLKEINSRKQSKNKQYDINEIGSQKKIKCGSFRINKKIIKKDENLFKFEREKIVKNQAEFLKQKRQNQTQNMKNQNSLLQDQNLSYNQKTMLEKWEEKEKRVKKNSLQYLKKGFNFQNKQNSHRKLISQTDLQLQNQQQIQKN